MCVRPCVVSERFADHDSGRSMASYTLAMFRAALVLIAVLCCAFAQSPEQQIRSVLAAQVDAWNQGDIDSFMNGYENSPETTFIGKSVQHGYEAVRERYHQSYPTKEKMGHLTFTGLAVRPLGTDYASVTGAFHLKFAAPNTPEASGVFSLLFRHTPGGWKVILDHTS